MDYRWLFLPAFVAAVVGVAVLKSEMTGSDGGPQQLNSRPAGAVVKKWQAANQSWIEVGHTPASVVFDTRVGLFLWGHRSQLLESPPAGSVRLAPTPAYAALLAAPWLCSLACLMGVVVARRQARLLEEGAQREQIREEGIEPGMWVGPYQIEKIIGNGAQAEVFLARDAAGQAFALKIMAAQLSRDREARTRFEREVDSGTRFHHPNIMPILRWSVMDGRYWLAQPYMAQGSLADRVTAGLPERQVIDWLADVCAGLVYAHAHKVIHRDLKPQNVLLDEGGRALLADFGLARGARYETITADETVLGTPAYMAPEQIQGQPVTWLSDLYSVGIMGYELVTGTLPFQGDVVQVLIAQMSQEPPPIEDRRPDCSPGLRAIVNRLIKKDPAQRFSSALEVQRALESLCN